ncbi:hypothetical protein ACJW31_09G167700 [Castanea mollissima]
MSLESITNNTTSKISKNFVAYHYSLNKGPNTSYLHTYKVKVDLLALSHVEGKLFYPGNHSIESDRNCADAPLNQKFISSSIVKMKSLDTSYHKLYSYQLYRLPTKLSTS